MKRNILCLCLSLTGLFARAQNGLECIVVEKYYVSDANDSIGNDLVSLSPGTLPAGSVTYRVYADMLPGYQFQAAYGVPGHELRIETSTLFFNNEDRGATTPNAINNNFMNQNTVMLDSWLSVGAASSTKYGIMKNEDDSNATLVNVDGLLQNTDASAGIPLTVQDGLIAGTPAPEQVTFVGFGAELDSAFGAETVSGLVSTYNAAWSSLSGSKGRPDSLANKVLIGQFTTNGTFSFKLNVQIRTFDSLTSQAVIENYVAENPVDSEITLSCLTFNSDSLPMGISQHASPASPSFAIYPNPATEMLTLLINQGNEKKSTVEYKIMDITGKVILSKSLGQVAGRFLEHADVSSLRPGIYLVEVSQDGTTAHKKLIKN